MPDIVLEYTRNTPHLRQYPQRKEFAILTGSLGNGLTASRHLETTPEYLLKDCRVLGQTLDWFNTKKAAQQVRNDGIEQLIMLWRKTKDRDNDPFLWGDETEGMLLVFHNELRQVQPYTGVANLIANLNADRKYPKLDGLAHCAAEFQPEGASFVVESAPEKPWGVSSRDLMDVEANMKSRRALIKKHMKFDGCFVTLAAFPRLGAREDSSCQNPPSSSDEARSQFVRDDMISPHVRYKTIERSVRSRRGRKVEMNIPVYRDKETPWPFHDPTVNYNLHRWPEDEEVRNGAVKENHIYMDSTSFGVYSCCALQVTVQARNMDDARMLYDQLLPMCPILLALTAATPMTKGFLADTDARWNMVAASVDDRTPEESGDKPLCDGRRIPKPRCSSGSTYISQDPRLREEYSDPALIIDGAIKQKLLDVGMDQRLATHFAHLFIRDPLVVYNEDLEKVDINQTKRFEMFQSTNWQTLRFKPPALSMKGIGWRVEFRAMEVQITDFENAAFSIFIVLLTKTILHFNLNLYIPIAKIDENMEIAHTRNAVVSRSFFFRTSITPETVRTELPSRETSTNGGDFQDAPSINNNGPVTDEYKLMSINKIINGESSSPSQTGSPGLIPLIQKYLDTCDYDPPTRSRLDQYLNFIKGRANGDIPTTAKWLRSFVQSHPEYESNSIVGEGVIYDLIKRVREISDGDFSDGLRAKL